MQFTVIAAVAVSNSAGLLCSSYEKLAAPQKPAAGVNVKAPDDDRSTVPPTGVP